MQVAEWNNKDRVQNKPNEESGIVKTAQQTGLINDLGHSPHGECAMIRELHRPEEDQIICDGAHGFLVYRSLARLNNIHKVEVASIC